MEKLTLIFSFTLLAIFVTGCNTTPTPNSTAGEAEASTLSRNDVTALGLKFDSMFEVRFGNTINITNGDGSMRISKLNKDEK